MTKTIISLSAVPPRFGVLGENLNALLRQTAKIDAINLYIPKTYRRFQYQPEDLPQVPEGVSIRQIDADLGPATKVLPACNDYRNQDVRIIFCDDDKIYDPEWAQRLINASDQRPDACICEEGGLFGMPHYPNHDWSSDRHPKAAFIKKNLGYRLRRAATLGRWKPSKIVSSGYVDILEGWGGALVRPDFFDAQSYDIPDVLWTVDDVWLSGCLERRGIPIWIDVTNKVRSKDSSDEVASASLRKFVSDGHDRFAANRACIDYYRETYGIWGGDAQAAAAS